METPETHSNAGRFDALAFAIILSAAIAVAYVYYRTVDRPFLGPRLELHESIVHGTADAPYRYRVLVPVFSEGVTRALGILVPRDMAFLAAYALYDVVAVLLFLWLLFAYARAWFTREQALVAVLFAAATLPIALRDHYFQPWSILEAALFTAGLVCAARRRYLLLALVTLVASLNRETAVFIPIAFLFTSLGVAGPGEREAPLRRIVALFAGYTAIWAAVVLGLRGLLGPGTNVASLAELWSRNTASAALVQLFIRLGLLFGAFWIFAAAGYGRAPRFVRRAAFVAIPYGAAILVWGIWHEVRLFMPFYPLVLPLGLSFLYRPRADT